MKHWLWLSLIVVLVDQATKWLVMGGLEPFEVIEVVPNLNLTLMFNTGAAFSFLAEAGGWQRWLFAAFALAISAALVVWLLRLREQERTLAIALALIIGGAVGNLIDRLRLGYVVDFIDVFWRNHHWPAFNAADSAITIGIALLVVDMLRKPDEAASSQSSLEAAQPQGRTD